MTPRSSARPVAVIDIGSNSIKTLVADRAPDGSLRSVAEKTLDVRISAGISRERPRLTDDSMTRGLEAIRELVEFAATHSPARVALVATSAVRDAQNGADFRKRVRAATGHAIRLLSGAEEAALIGRGLTCDPALGGVRDFYVFDLGGGSLECLAFRDRHVAQSLSLQLGCVRLTEKFIADPATPVPPDESAAIARHTATTLAGSAFAFSLPAGAVAVGTGGTITTVRAILAARAGCDILTVDSLIPLDEFRRLRGELAAMPLERRCHVPGLPEKRADVFPAALTTLIAVAEAGGFAAYRHSFYNLRFGLADEALG
ncbi:MAG TPA: phosphatase [Opitutus sp.]|nr:phosphatase [Opitutus sp.]